MCPVHWVRSFITVIWEDDIKPRLIDLVLLLTFLGMGSVFGLLIIMLVIIIAKISSFL